MLICSGWVLRHEFEDRANMSSIRDSVGWRLDKESPRPYALYYVYLKPIWIFSWLFMPVNNERINLNTQGGLMSVKKILLWIMVVSCIVSGAAYAGNSGQGNVNNTAGAFDSYVFSLRWQPT